MSSAASRFLSSIGLRPSATQPPANTELTPWLIVIGRHPQPVGTRITTDHVPVTLWSNGSDKSAIPKSVWEHYTGVHRAVDTWCNDTGPRLSAFREMQPKTWTDDGFMSKVHDDLDEVIKADFNLINTDESRIVCAKVSDFERDIQSDDVDFQLRARNGTKV